MIQYKKKSVMKEVDIIKSITVTCNKCLTSHKIKVKNNDISTAIASSELKSFEYDFDLDSSFSGESWSFNLCENCFLSIVKDFKLLPKGFKENPFSKDNLTIHNKQELFIEWKEKE